MKRIAALLATALVMFAARSAAADPNEDRTVDLSIGWALKAEKRLDEAAAAFERARANGANPQLIDLELGYIAALRGDANAARSRFAAAAKGPDAELAQRASAELAALAPAAAPPSSPPAPSPEAAPPPPPKSALAEGYRAKASGDLPAARAAFERARDDAREKQLASMELGYLAANAGDPETARARFDEAANGRDRELGEQARREKRTLPRHFFGDAYLDAYGWDRQAGVSNGSAIVPTLRLRAFFRPRLDIPIDIYASGQVTRDTASRGYVGLALPKVYSDNYAVLGAGVRAKLWKRLDLFAQAGPAFNLLSDGRDRTALDVRAGAMFFAETKDCAPPPEHGVRAKLWPCADAYFEGIYVSRFDNDVIGYARPRAAAGLLITGPVLWQIVAEGRVGKDTNNDYWNNFADAGGGPRVRLLAPFRFDVLFTASGGTYFGLANRDPAPSQLTYVDLRVLASTYLEL